MLLYLLSITCLRVNVMTDVLYCLMLFCVAKTRLTYTITPISLYCVNDDHNYCTTNNNPIFIRCSIKYIFLEALHLLPLLPFIHVTLPLSYAGTSRLAVLFTGFHCLVMLLSVIRSMVCIDKFCHFCRLSRVHHRLHLLILF